MKKRKINRVILFGGSLILLDVAKNLISQKYEVYIFSSKRQILEIVNSKGTLQNNLRINGIKYYISSDINKSKKLISLVNSKTVGFGFGEAWSFDEKIIKIFQGYLIDYMGIPLPKYRGGAHFTWMIMQNERNNGACLQIINQDMVQGVFDSGKIIDEIKFKNDKNSKPKYYFNKQIKYAKILINKFLINVNTDKKIILRKVIEKNSYFLPRLNTLKNGWINWYLWDSAEIISFINAFSDPYMGASSFIDKKRIFMKNAKRINNKIYHPFQSGIICKINANKSYDVITTSGIINIYNIAFEKKHNKIIVGSRIYTTVKKIEESYIFQANYDNNGLKNK